MPASCAQGRLPACMSSARLSRRGPAATVVSLTRSSPISAPNLDYSPHAHGFIAATSTKLAGKECEPRARLIVTTLSSNGWRNTSNTRIPNSGSSSRNNTPRCASEISPGRGQFPPPTSPACEMVWCGARNGRLWDHRRVGGQEIGHRVDSRDVERFLHRHRRQDRGQRPRQQRLPRAGRPEHDHIVPARGRLRQRPFDVLLASHFAEIGRHRQHAAHVPHRSVERELPDDQRALLF